ncbi:c-type cytochrome [Mesobacillus maritimus]|uniref:Cytochrome C n=1 Tax=Mesobacillus maritimus TaxID=1643336 RepID=A0ABS7K5D9_9BACI|nr:cytochrome C [Mesobacillus maritimus]MBY0097483.1 cytochrome C [Mesobacillus maritimus]
MPNSVASFIICAILGFGIGFAGFEIAGKDDVASTDAPTETAVNTESNEDNTPAEDSSNEEAKQPTTESVTSANSEILNTKGCLSCHSVSSLNLEGGATGPDLSKAFTEVEGKHGKPLNEFLKEPTSAVMSTVIGGNPLTDEEIQQVVDALQEASK